MANEGIKQIAFNRKAKHNYTITETLECGIELKGTEVKSVKGAHFSFTDAYAKIEAGELLLVGLHINPYEFGNIHNHDPDRTRKLLAHREEIAKLNRKVREKGLTLIPFKFYLKKGLVKVEVALCKGKKTVDKRASIKDRDMKRDAARDMKYR